MSGDSPQSLGRYRLVERLASGGMGEVYLARAEGPAGLEKTVAIKRVLPHLAADPAFVTRFLDEARLTVGLSHGNVVQVFDVGMDDGEYFLAMEYVDGCDLRTLLRKVRLAREALPTPLALQVAAEVCQGLAYVHDRRGPDGEPLGIIHRDVSPSNILLARSGQVKVSDFGVAKARAKRSQSVSGSIHGKYQYMSPEQAKGTSLTPSSDLFTVGTLLFEMLAGTRPFDADSDLATLERIRTADSESLARRRPDLPAAVVEIVERCHRAEASGRFESAHQLRQAIVSAMVQMDSLVGQRELSEYLGRWLEPEGPKALSLDEALALQLGGGPVPGAARGPSTQSSGSSHTATAGVAPSRSEATASLSAAPGAPGAERPLTGPSAPITRPEHTSPTVTVVEATRTLTGLKIAVGILTIVVLALVVVNLQLFQTTAALQADGEDGVAGSSAQDGSSAVVVPESGQAPGEERSGDAAAQSPPPKPPPPKPLPPAPSPAAIARVSGDFSRAVRRIGESAPVAPAAAEKPSAPDTAESSRTITVRARPKRALIQVNGDSGKTGRRRVRLERGDSASVQVTLDGYRTEKRTVSADGPRVVEVELREAAAKGEVEFRFFPANAVVSLNGKRLKTNQSNYIVRALPAGRHTLRVELEDGSDGRTKGFDIEAGKATQLGTIRLNIAGGAATVAP